MIAVLACGACGARSVEGTDLVADSDSDVDSDSAGDSDSDSDTGSVTPGSCDERAEAYLAALYDCCLQDPPFAYYEELADRRRVACEAERANPLLVIRRDEDAACAQALAEDWAACIDATYTRRFFPDHPCVTRLQGVGGAGDTCTIEEECELPLGCIGGVCAAWPELGDVCSGDAAGRCADDVFCRWDEVTGDERCVPRASFGETCFEREDSCVIGTQCSGGFCGSLLGNGEYCEAGWTCETGQCHGWGQCGPPGICWIELDY